MRQGSIRDTLAIEIKVPRGFAGYWQIIRDLDQQGPWTIREVSDQTNVKIKEVQDFVWRLHKGGYAEIIGIRETCPAWYECQSLSAFENAASLSAPAP